MGGRRCAGWTVRKIASLDLRSARGGTLPIARNDARLRSGQTGKEWRLWIYCAPTRALRLRYRRSRQDHAARRAAGAIHGGPRWKPAVRVELELLGSGRA